MPPLIEQLRNFLAWLNEHALPGFKEFSEEYYAKEHGYVVSYDALTDFSKEMKRAVEYDDDPNFDRYKAAYLRLFDDVNGALAKEIYRNALSKYMDKGHENLDAEKYALEEVWQDPKVRYYLDAKASMKGPQGDEVFIVANERHIPQDSSYVLTSEIAKLRNSNLDPWDYVLNRRA